MQIPENRLSELRKGLPFSLTSAQDKAIREILADITKSQPMNRLLEGDVGSGKTVVAAFACYTVFLNGFQSVVLAPTQILAKQHFNTLTNLLAKKGVKVELVTSDSKKKGNRGDVIVGTHALIQKDVSIGKLGLVVIDEQQRFGVTQRNMITKKGEGDLTPHVLTMTATPIPRTISLTVYGDLDLSVLDEMPKGRVKIKTWFVTRKKRDAAYKWINKKVTEGGDQAFIVCPLIEESAFESMKTVKAATIEFGHLQNEVFPNLNLGLLHGRMKPKEKNEVMKKFKEGKTHILVATPVVEVGIDIPNATIMLVEAAERFGLSQLHQLRGRVGRGEKQSYCLLFSEIESPHVVSRLKSLEKNHSGIKIAELDLKLRGPGDIYGTMQHGYKDLKIATFSDTEIIHEARQAALGILPELDKYPKVKGLILDLERIAPN